MVGVWVLVIMVVIASVAAIATGCYWSETTRGKVLVVLISVTVATSIAGGLLWWLYNTEAGAREIKSFQSDTNGGLSRTVTVYDIHGDKIKSYSGEFDVAYDDSRIIFDDEDGKRHVIYYTTGTVIIDEN